MGAADRQALYCHYELTFALREQAGIAAAALLHHRLQQHLDVEARLRQSYDANEAGLFDVDYADVLGIPFGFTAKPVPIKPPPPRETVLVRAITPERDACEIRFPRVAGYRVELPEERLTARFNDDSTLELTPRWSARPSHVARASSAKGSI